MIPPFAGTDPRSPHNSPEGMKFFFRALGIIVLVLWLGAGVFDGDWSEWGMLALGGVFFGLAWLMSKAQK